MIERRVVITGIGHVSPLPPTLEQFWNSLQCGEPAVRPFSLESSEPAPICVAAPALFNGNIDDFADVDPSQKKAIKKSLKVMSREIQMGLAASSRAVADAGISFGQFPASRVGVSFGSDYILTTVDECIDGIKACLIENREHGSRLVEFDYTKWGQIGLPKMSPLWQLKYLPNMPASHIAILNGFHGPSNSMTLREASIGAVVGESIAIIASGRTDLMLVGTTGSRLHPIKMIHAVQQEELATEACKPFDKDRDGTVLGEGAGAFVLEEREHAIKRGATIYAEVVSASYRARFHRNRFNRSGVDERREVIGQVLREVLHRGNRTPEQIGHVNAHGLGGRKSDIAESLAIADVFADKRGGCSIPVCAAKGFFGNLGAGAGSVELAAGILALRNGKLFPTPNFRTPDADCPIRIASAGEPSGDSFVKIAVNPQGQASALLVVAER